MKYNFNAEIAYLNLEIKNKMVRNVFLNTLMRPYTSYDELYTTSEEFNFNYCTYKASENINSLYLGLNGFLIQIYMLLNNKNKGIIEKHNIKDNSDLIKDYSQSFANSNINKIKDLMNYISNHLKKDLKKETFFFKVIEVLIRNNVCHGFNLVLEEIFTNHSNRRRTRNYSIFVNKNYDEYNLVMEIKKCDEIHKLINNLKDELCFKESKNLKIVSEKEEFIKLLEKFNRKSLIYEDNRKVIFNENSLRVYLTRNYYNRYIVSKNIFKIKDAKFSLRVKSILNNGKNDNLEVSSESLIKECNKLIKIIDLFFCDNNIDY